MYFTLPSICTLLMNLHSGDQFEQAPEEGADFPRRRPPAASAPNYRPQPLALQGVAAVGVRGPALRVVPRAVLAVAQPARRALPRPQLHQRVRPQAQVERRHARPVMPQLLLARPMNLLGVVVA